MSGADLSVARKSHARSARTGELMTIKGDRMRRPRARTPAMTMLKIAL